MFLFQQFVTQLWHYYHIADLDSLSGDRMLQQLMRLPLGGNAYTSPYHGYYISDCFPINIGKLLLFYYATHCRSERKKIILLDKCIGMGYSFSVKLWKKENAPRSRPYATKIQPYTVFPRKQACCVLGAFYGDDDNILTGEAL